MKNLSSEIARVEAPKGGLALWWLGQAGFALKNARGTVFYLDPYLSDAIERTPLGYKRLTPAPIAADDAIADWVISTHEHLDHLDADSLPIMARNNPACHFAGPASCLPIYGRLGISESRCLGLCPGKHYELGGITIHVARADHGTPRIDAVSLLFDFNGYRVLFTGDTALNVPWMEPLMDLHPDLLIPCINGAYGNMNAEEAAKLTALIRPRLVIPDHYGTFKEHNGDPEAFIQACAWLCPDVPVRLLQPGEGLCCTLDEVTPIGGAPDE